jgi:hypothetical protein
MPKRTIRIALTVAIAVAVAALAAVPAPAAPQAAEPSTRARVWELGGKLSLAAVAAANAMPKPTVDKVFADAQKLGASLGVDVPALPERKLDRAEAQADALGYLLRDAGSPVAGRLGTTYGPDHAALFEIAVKTNLLLMFYSPGDTQSTTIAELVRKRAPDARLPDALWRDLPAKIEARASYDVVKAAVQKLHGDVRRHLRTES